MKKIIQIVAAVVVIASMNGCATPYMRDRVADAKDIFTATVGIGGGAKARVGPIQAAMFFNQDSAGLRGGEWYSIMETQELSFASSGIVEASTPLPGILALIGGFPILTSVDKFYPKEEENDRRNKNYEAYGILIPGITIGNRGYYYTQAEMAVGIGGTIRLGFNPGELLDFILGWTTIDIFKDDLGIKREK